MSRRSRQKLGDSSAAGSAISSAAGSAPGSDDEPADASAPELEDGAGEDVGIDDGEDFDEDEDDAPADGEDEDEDDDAPDPGAPLPGSDAARVLASVPPRPLRPPPSATHWRCRKFTSESETERCYTASSAEGVRASEWPVRLFSAEVVRQTWGGGTYQVHWLTLDEAKGGYRQCGATPAFAVDPPAAPASAPAAPSPIAQDRGHVARDAAPPAPMTHAAQGMVMAPAGGPFAVQASGAPPVYASPAPPPLGPAQLLHDLPPAVRGTMALSDWLLGKSQEQSAIFLAAFREMHREDVERREQHHRMTLELLRGQHAQAQAQAHSDVAKLAEAVTALATAGANDDDDDDAPSAGGAAMAADAGPGMITPAHIDAIVPRPLVAQLTGLLQTIPDSVKEQAFGAVLEWIRGLTKKGAPSAAAAE